MTITTLNILSPPDETGTDVLTALLRNGARQLITQAVEAELQQLRKPTRINTYPMATRS